MPRVGRALSVPVAQPVSVLTLQRLEMASNHDTTIYVDESGDLGVGVGASTHFLIATVTAPTPRGLTRVKNDTCKRFGMKRQEELHAYHLREPVRQYALERLAAQQVGIRAIIANKSKLNVLREPDNWVWNYLAAQLLSRHIVRLRNPMIYVDARSIATSAPLEFPDYLREKTRERAFKQGSGNVRFDLEYRDSKDSVGIQMADLCAYAFTQYYAHGEGAERSAIAGKVEHEWLFTSGEHG
jgi:hypothetical protein